MYKYKLENTEQPLIQPCQMKIINRFKNVYQTCISRQQKKKQRVPCIINAVNSFLHQEHIK